MLEIHAVTLPFDAGNVLTTLQKAVFSVITNQAQ